MESKRFYWNEPFCELFHMDIIWNTLTFDPNTGREEILFWKNKDFNTLTNGASVVALRTLCFVLEAELSVSLWKTHFHTDGLVFSTKMSNKVKATHGALWRRINIRSLVRWRALQLLKSDALVTVFVPPACGTNTHFPLWTLSSSTFSDYLLLFLTPPCCYDIVIH